jgi:hypothetical protein
MAWILVNIGCIECHVSTAIVGVFSDKARAEALAETLYMTHGWREGGQNAFEVFEMPALDVVAHEYTSAECSEQGPKTHPDEPAK